MSALSPQPGPGAKAQATVGPSQPAKPHPTLPVAELRDDDDDDDDVPFQKPAKPGRSRPMNEHERWDSIKSHTSLGLCFAMPLLMAMPPRKMDGYTAVQGIMLLWAANEQLERRTGKDLMWHSERPWRWGLGKIRAIVNAPKQNRDATSGGVLAEEGKRRLREPVAMMGREDGQGTSAVGGFQRYSQEDGNSTHELEEERRRIVKEVEMAMRGENSRPGGYWDKMKAIMWTRSEFSTPDRGREG